MSQTASPLALTLAASAHVAVLALFAIALALIFQWRRHRIAGTTLVAPSIWALISYASLVAAEVAIALAGEPPPQWAPALRYAAAMSTFCPIVALLGAKRPQDRGWQWIVLSLWAILCQPAAEWLLFGGVAEVHPARFWFLVILMTVGATNGLGTRHWPSSLLYGGGQLALLLPYVSADAPLAGGQAALWGLSGILLSWILIGASRLPGRKPRMPLDRAWLDFRDAFGVVWALRILERMNASAKMYDWPLTLSWQGFCPRESAQYDEVPAAVEESFRTLLRRFVSPEWIDTRVSTSQQRTPAEVTAQAG
jgi:hypothetical protein